MSALVFWRTLPTLEQSKRRSEMEALSTAKTKELIVNEIVKTKFKIHG